MSTGPTNSSFKNIGDWLIWRSEGPLGDFRMPVCISIIRNEGYTQGWAYQIQESDIERIVARYKEHVNFWHIDIAVIRQELNDFSSAIGRDFNSIAMLFDKLDPRRIPRQ